MVLGHDLQKAYASQHLLDPWLSQCADKFTTLCCVYCKNLRSNDHTLLWKIGFAFIEQHIAGVFGAF